MLLQIVPFTRWAEECFGLAEKGNLILQSQYKQIEDKCHAQPRDSAISECRLPDAARSRMTKLVVDALIAFGEGT